MRASRAQEAAPGAFAAVAGKTIASRLVDASLILLLVATPFFASHSGAETFVVLAVVTFAGALVIYQKGRKPEREFIDKK